MAENNGDEHFINKIFLPESALLNLPTDFSVKDEYLLMFRKNYFALESGSVYVFPNVDGSPLWAEGVTTPLWWFSFERVEYKGVELLERYGFISGLSKIYPLMEKRYSLFRVSMSLFSGPGAIITMFTYLQDVTDDNGRNKTVLLYFPDFDETTLTLLRPGPEKIQRYAVRFLNVLCYFQSRMLREQKRIIAFQKRQRREVGNRRAVSENKKTLYPSIKIGGIKYVYEKEVEKPESRQFVRHTPSWSVRGHYRRYKNGKVVFIKPYVKGKGRVKETVYQL